MIFISPRPEESAKCICSHFVACHDLPVTTRMVLEGNGSTTLMLNILADSQLFSEVVICAPLVNMAMQCKSVAAVFPRNEWHGLVIRRTRLRDVTGGIVSENILIYRESDESALFPVGNIPFGLHTRELGLFERRQLLEYGLTGIDFGSIPRSAAGRAYGIAFSNGKLVLVHEVFNPVIVPTALSSNGARSNIERPIRPSAVQLPTTQENVRQK